MYRHHLEKLSRTRLDDVLADEGVIERSRIEEAQAEQERTGKQLSEVLSERDILDEYEMAKLVATHYSLPYLDLAGYSPRREVEDLLPYDFCRTHAILALDCFGDSVTLAVCEMPGPELMREILERTKLTPFFFVAVRRTLLEVLEKTRKKPGRHAASVGPARTASTEPHPVRAGPAGPASAGVPAPEPKPVAQPAQDELPGAVEPAAARSPEALAEALVAMDLPSVSMKLNGMGPGSSRLGQGPRKDVEQSTPAPPVVATPTAALGWMDVAAGSTGRAPPDPTRPRLAARTPPVIPQPAGPRAAQVGRSAPASRPAFERSPTSRVGKPPHSPAAAPRPEPPAPTPPAKKPGQAGWESIFDLGEESVRKGGGPAGRS